MTPDLADYRARCFVSGVRRHGRSGKMEPASGEFHERFLNHPWVRESIMEGWDRELRGHLAHACKVRVMRGERLGEIESLMPDQGWVAAAKHNAARYRAAQQWRDETYGKVDGVALLRRLGILPPGDAA